MSKVDSQTDATKGNDTAQPVKTEQQMREIDSPRPKSLEELTDFIKELSEQQHDYGTCVYAMSLAATEAYNFMASHLGVSGFQAGAASIDTIKRIRHIEGPFMIVELSNELYEAGRCEQKVAEYISESRMWLRKMAREKLSNGDYFHPAVFHSLMDFATCVPTNDDQVDQWNKANPDDQITGPAWYDKNRADLDAYCEKLKLLRDMGGYSPSEEFVENRIQDFKRFGFDSIHLSVGDVSKATSCKEGCSHRIEMPVSLEFSRDIDGVTISFSVDTEIPGSNGRSGYHFDFELMESMAKAAIPAVRETIETYILKARAAQKSV